MVARGGHSTEGLMEQVTQKKMALFAGRASTDLAEDVAAALGIEVGESNVEDFANGEIHCRFSTSVRGSDVFILNTHTAWNHHSINDSLMEHLVMVDAAKRASAKRITVVAPFYGYGRQDRKAAGREPITAKLIANMFRAAGASRLVSIDLHSGQIQGFFDGPVDHLTAMPVLVDYLKMLGTEDLVVVSPDAGRVKVAERYANKLGASLAIVHKSRVVEKKNMVEAKEVVGEVEGKTCVVIDDMIDTGGTIVAAADVLFDKGAKSVLAATTHPVLSGPAVDRLKNSCIEKVIVTDTLPLGPEKQFDKLVVLTVSKILARAIEAVFMDTTVSEIFDGNNQM